MLELLSNNSLFVGWLYDDKSLTLRARDLSSLQLTSKQWIITQQFTARAVLIHRPNWKQCRSWAEMHLHYFLKRVKTGSAEQWLKQFDNLGLFLFWFYMSQSTIFQSCREGSSWIEPVLITDKVSCSRTQCNASGAAWTRNPSNPSQALYHWATASVYLGIMGNKDELLILLFFNLFTLFIYIFVQYTTKSGAHKWHILLNAKPDLQIRMRI